MAEPIDMDDFKAKAKQQAKDTGCGSSRAHEVLARSLGYNTYAAMRAAWKAQQLGANHG